MLMEGECVFVKQKTAYEMRISDWSQTCALPILFHEVAYTFVCETIMNLGYARISKADGSQTLDLQIDALTAAGVAQEHLYQDEASGKRDDRPGLEACLKALREGDA